MIDATQVMAVSVVLEDGQLASLNIASPDDLDGLRLPAVHSCAGSPVLLLAMLEKVASLPPTHATRFLL